MLQKPKTLELRDAYKLFGFTLDEDIQHQARLLTNIRRDELTGITQNLQDNSEADQQIALVKADMRQRYLSFLARIEPLMPQPLV